MSFPWQAEGVEERLTKLWVEDGLSSSKIAADLSAFTGVPLTRNAVIGRIGRLGLVGKGNPARSFGPQEPEVDLAPPPPTPPVEDPTPETVPASPAVLAETCSPIGVGLTALRTGQCRFPVTPHHAPAHLFCAAVVEAPGATYCPEHAAICFDRRTPQQRRADQDRAARMRAGKEAA